MNLFSQASCGDLYCRYCFSKLLLLCLFFQNKPLWRLLVALVMKASFGED